MRWKLSRINYLDEKKGLFRTMVFYINVGKVKLIFIERLAAFELGKSPLGT